MFRDRTAVLDRHLRDQQSLLTLHMRLPEEDDHLGECKNILCYNLLDSKEQQYRKSSRAIHDDN